MEVTRKVYKIKIGKLEAKRPHMTQVNKGDNMIMDSIEVNRDNVVWTSFIWLRISTSVGIT
jgi:hypothetical protein